MGGVLDQLAEALGVVLTGMGQDGTRGSQAIRDAGGRIIAQDEASSVVWGMAGSVANAGLVDGVWPIQELGRVINERVRVGRPGWHWMSPAGIGPHQA